MTIALTATGVVFSDGSTQPAATNIVLQAPGAIGGTTPNSGAFTTLTAGGSAVLTQATFNSVSAAAAGTTLSSGQRFFVTSAGQTVTLPASPAAGAIVTIGVPSGVTDTLVGRNGQPIMSLAEDMTINAGNVSVTLEYVDATLGWRII